MLANETDISAVHPSNALSSNVFILEGRPIPSSEVQFWNVPKAIDVRLQGDSKYTSVRAEQAMNARRPISVKLDGIWILLMEEHPSNALCPILVTPDGMLKVFRDVQPENVSTPILVRCLGRFTLVMLEQL